MNRRNWLQSTALAPLALALPRAQAANKHSLGLVIHSYWVRRERPMNPDFSSIADPIAFLKHAAHLGSPGIQTKIEAKSPEDCQAIREAADNLGMYIEGIVSLPKNQGEAGRFEAEILASKRAGATIVRSVCLSGRRYETFRSQEQFQAFRQQSEKSLEMAGRIAIKHQVKLAIENHKDWRIEEMLDWLKRFGGEYLGVCLDTGNSIALLEEPHQVVEAYVPWTITTHFKDMAVSESAQGFLLSEVPLGTGFLDLKRMVATLKKARPDLRLNLEMITRDPLSVPCLTPAYWQTLGEVRGRELAEAMARIKKVQSAKPLFRIQGLSPLEQLQAEANNINLSVAYAQEHLKGKA